MKDILWLHRRDPKIEHTLPVLSMRSAYIWLPVSSMLDITTPDVVWYCVTLSPCIPAQEVITTRSFPTALDRMWGLMLLILCLTWDSVLPDIGKGVKAAQNSFKSPEPPAQCSWWMCGLHQVRTESHNMLQQLLLLVLIAHSEQTLSLSPEPLTTATQLPF